MRSLRQCDGVRSARTDRDSPLWVVGVGSLFIVVVCTARAFVNDNVLGAVLLLVLGFLFVTVSSRPDRGGGSSSIHLRHDLATLLITS